MSELRLVPAALLVWAVNLSLLVAGSPAVALTLVVGWAVVLVMLREPGQAVLSAGVGLAAALLTGARQRRARDFQIGRASCRERV